MERRWWFPSWGLLLSGAASHPLSWSTEERGGCADSPRSWFFQDSLDGPAGSSPVFPGQEDGFTALLLSLRPKPPQLPCRACRSENKLRLELYDPC